MFVGTSPSGLFTLSWKKKGGLAASRLNILRPVQGGYAGGPSAESFRGRASSITSPQCFKHIAWVQCVWGCFLAGETALSIHFAVAGSVRVRRSGSMGVMRSRFRGLTFTVGAV